MSHMKNKIDKDKVLKEIDEKRFAAINLKDGQLTIEPRPVHCDRGNFIVKAFAFENQINLYIDDADLFPRYYFGFDNMISELEAWIAKNNQTITKTIGEKVHDK